jgi:hypothetical protein
MTLRLSHGCGIRARGCPLRCFRCFCRESADHIEKLHRRFGCDGMAFTLPVWSPEEIRRVGELVLPRLEAKGIWILPASRDWGW